MPLEPPPDDEAAAVWLVSVLVSRGTLPPPWTWSPVPEPPADLSFEVNQRPERHWYVWVFDTFDSQDEFETWLAKWDPMPPSWETSVASCVPWLVGRDG